MDVVMSKSFYWVSPFLLLVLQSPNIPPYYLWFWTYYSL